MSKKWILRLRQLLLGISLVVTLLLALAYFYFPFLAERFLIAQAPEWGIRITELKASRPGINTIRLHSLNLEHPSFRATLTDAGLTYSLSSLLFGKLQDVHVSQGKIILDEKLFIPAADDDETAADSSVYTALRKLPLTHLTGERIELLIKHPQGLIELSASVKLQNSLARLSGDALLLINYSPAPEDYRVQGRGRLELEDEVLRAKFFEATAVTEPLSIEGVKLDALELKLNGDARGTFNLQDAASEASLPITAPQLRATFSGSTLSLSKPQAELSWNSSATPRFAAVLQAPSAALQHQLSSYDLRRLKLTLEHDIGRSKAEFFFSTAGESISLKGSFSGSVDTLQADGRVEARLEQPGERRKELTEFLAALGLPLEITAGSARADLHISVKRNTEVPSSPVSFATELLIEASELSGSYKQMGFSGLNLRNLRPTLPDLRISRPASLTLEKLNAGIELTDAKLALTRYRPEEVVSYTEASIKLFGGELFLEPGEIDLSRSSITIPLQVRGLMLQKVLMLFAEQGVSGSGTLNGSLPTQITSEGVTIENGLLYSAAPGVIRYRNPKVAQEGKLAIVMKALENFHYDSLKAKVDYRPSGQLVTALELSGKNPELDQNREINLNLNVEQNVLSLLRSLNLPQELEETLSGD